MHFVFIQLLNLGKDVTQGQFLSRILLLYLVALSRLKTQPSLLFTNGWVCEKRFMLFPMVLL